jgi:hypothetical protein
MKLKNTLFRTFFLILIIGLSISSCKKDTPQTDLIVGTWTAGTPTFTAMVGTRTLTQYYTDVMGLTSAQALQLTTAANLAIQQNFTGTAQFKSDNTYVSTLGGTNGVGAWSLSTDGKTLTLTTGSATPMNVTVTQLTAHNLTINFDDSASEDLNSDGTPETININVTLPFTK